MNPNPYILKLKDTEITRDGKFKDCPLYFERFFLDDKQSGCWEYSIAQAMRFATKKEALDVLATEHAKNKFHKKDELFLVNIDDKTITPIDRVALDKVSKVKRVELQEEHKAFLKAQKEAIKKREKAEKFRRKMGEAEPAVDAVTVDLCEEIVVLTNGTRPDTIGI